MTKQTILNTIITVVPTLNRHSLSFDIYIYDFRDFLLRGRSQSSGHEFCFPETSDPGPVRDIGSVFSSRLVGIGSGDSVKTTDLHTESSERAGPLRKCTA